jgi:hypothetical protein
MPTINESGDGFARTIYEMKVLLGQVDPDRKPFIWYTQFGFHGYVINIHQSHLQYLADLNSSLSAWPPAFEAETIERWQLVNDLLVEGLQSTHTPESRISRNAGMLACLVVFPTLPSHPFRAIRAGSGDRGLSHPLSKRSHEALATYRRSPPACVPVGASQVESPVSDVAGHFDRNELTLFESVQRCQRGDLGICGAWPGNRDNASAVVEVLSDAMSQAGFIAIEQACDASQR